MTDLTPIQNTRNLGIIAHINAGKTTTTERMLFNAGVTRRMGEVDHGSATMDWMPQEQERGITITAAATSFDWNGVACNLIDLPGHVDFTVEVERSLRVLDGAVAIFCASRGVQPQSETVWRQANRYKIPRIAFINKCDRSGANTDATVEAIRQRLRANPIVLQLPHKLEEDFDGIIDLIHLRSRSWEKSSEGQPFQDVDVPDELLDEAKLARGIMLEALAEVDDSVMAKYLAEIEISPLEIKQALRRATLAMRAVPVVMGAAKQNQGVQCLLDAIVDYLPAPSDLSDPAGVDPIDGQTKTRQATADQPTSALAFKVMHDPQLGQLTFLRIYSGQLKVGERVLNASKNRLEQIDRLVKMHANESRDIDLVSAGDIAAVSGLKVTSTGDTLCAASAPIVYDSIRFPKPVIRMALEMDNEDQRGRLLKALEALVAEDPTFAVEDDAFSGQVVITGMGELHLEVVVERLNTDFGLAPKVGRPQVAYKSTIKESKTLSIRHVYGGTSGGGKRGQYAGLTLTAAPSERDEGIVISFDSSLEVPKSMAIAAEKGLQEAFADGAHGHASSDLRVKITQVDYHNVDSSELSFKIAGLKAGREVLDKCQTTLLEPIMSLEIVTPDESVGDVISDLNARRGKITGITAESGVQVVACLVPLAEMFGYSTDLRSRTQGRASYSMEFYQYSEVPSGIVETLVKHTTVSK